MDDTRVHISHPCNENIAFCGKEIPEESTDDEVIFSDICVVCIETTKCSLCGEKVHVKAWLMDISTVKESQ